MQRAKWRFGKREGDKEVGRLFEEMELGFDLIRLRELQSGLARDDAMLAAREERLKGWLREDEAPGSLARGLFLRIGIRHLGMQRRRISRRHSEISLFTDEVEFNMKMRGMRIPAGTPQNSV